jgi:hypothetical protein
MPDDSKGRKYPKVMGAWSNAPADAEAGEWVSQADAAEALNVTVLRIGWLIACERLTAVNGPNGAGVTRASLDSEVAWRKQATFSRRLGRCIQNIVRWF